MINTDIEQPSYKIYDSVLDLLSDLQRNSSDSKKLRTDADRKETRIYVWFHVLNNRDLAADTRNY
jgi:hypothetical protein